MRGLVVRRIRGASLPGWLILAASFAGMVAAHAAPPADGAAKVSRLIDVSGIRHTSQQVLPSMLASIDAPQPGMTAQVRAAMRDAATQAFQPDPIIERVRARLGSGLTPRQLDDTLAWLDTPLGRRITTMENEASDPGSHASVQAYGRELAANPPSKERATLIRDLDRATGASELAASLAEAAALATILGINASHPAMQQAPGDALRKQVRANLAKTRKEFDRFVMTGLHYTYRALSDQEIAAYLRFLTSQSGVAYCKSTNSALNEALTDAIGRFMVTLPKSLDRFKGARGA